MEPRSREIDGLLVSLCRAARTGGYGDAASDLNRCLLLFQEVQSGGAIKTLPPALVNKFNYSLETVFLMLKNKDWVAIADIVEYELIAIWREMAGSIDAQ
jgi:hypothetical protein